MFLNPWIFWHHQMRKHYQNITGLLMFSIVFEIHYNYFNVLSFGRKFVDLLVFFFSTRQNVRARKIGRASEILHAQLGSGTQFVHVWFRTLSNTFDVNLCKNSSQLLAFNYFRKKFHWLFYVFYWLL